MEFESKTVRSRPGLSQEEALLSLQDHPQYVLGTKIKSFRQRENYWVAHIMEPKTSEFPPKKDEEEEPVIEKEVIEEKPKGDSDSGSDDSDDDSGPDGDSDSPFPPKDEDKDKKSEKGQLGEVLNLLHTLLTALGIDTGPDSDLLGGPDKPPPPPGADGPPPPGPPGMGGPPGMKGPGHPSRPLRPGDAPPGATPVGAPAFASVQEMATRLPSITAETDARLTVKQAKAELDRLYGPHYSVKQIRRDGDKTRALLSVR